MSDALTYYAALQLLPKAKNRRLLAMLDAVAATGLTAWSARAPAAGNVTDPPISLLALKDEIVGSAQEVLQGLSEWRTCVSRFTRSERLTAVHAVVVVTSYFEAFAEEGLPAPAERLVLTGSEQTAPATLGTVPDGCIDIVEFLLREPLPLPEPHRSYAHVRGQLVDCYTNLSNRLIKFVSGLAVWDDLDAGARDALKEAVRLLPAPSLPSCREAPAH
jgi:hypothetical protein